MKFGDDKGDSSSSKSLEWLEHGDNISGCEGDGDGDGDCGVTIGKENDFISDKTDAANVAEDVEHEDKLDFFEFDNVEMDFNSSSDGYTHLRLFLKQPEQAGFLSSHFFFLFLQQKQPVFVLVIFFFGLTIWEHELFVADADATSIVEIFEHVGVPMSIGLWSFLELADNLMILWYSR